MAVGAQHRQDQERAYARGHQAAGEHHQEMRQRSVVGDDRRRVAADAEEGRAGEIDHAGKAELHRQPERRHHHQHRGRHHQDGEMRLMQKDRCREHAEHGGEVERGLVGADAVAHPRDQSGLRRRYNRAASAKRQMIARWLLGGQEQDRVDGCDRGAADGRQP